MHRHASIVAFIALFSVGRALPEGARVTEKITATPTLKNRQLDELSMTVLGTDGPMPSWFSSIDLSSVSQTPRSISTLPAATGTPPEYPDDNDCRNIQDSQNSGPKRWEMANANHTLSCFTSLYKEEPLFNGNMDFDMILAQYFGTSNNHFSCGLGDTFAHNCHSDVNCENLRPYSLRPSNGSRHPGYGCQPENRDFHHKATGWVVISSMINYGTYLQSILGQVQKAISNADVAMGQEGSFLGDFGKPPADTTTPLRIALTVLTTMLGVAAGGIGMFTEGIASAAIINAVPAITSSVAGGAVAIGTANLTVPTASNDMTGWWADLTGHLIGSYEHYASSLYQKGYVSIPATPSTRPYNVTLIDLFKSGLWAGDDSWEGENKTAIALIEQALYAQMAQTVWTLSDKQYPFISVWDGDCSDSSKLDSRWMGQKAGDVDFKDVSASINGKCYSLLAAEPTSCRAKPGAPGVSSPTISTCCQWRALTGASNAKLDGKAYAGLKLTDMIKSAVAGWEQNHKMNGYNVSALTTDVMEPKYPRSISDVGVVNLIPVCNYSDGKGPGKGCPDMYNEGQSCKPF